MFGKLPLGTLFPKYLESQAVAGTKRLPGHGGSSSPFPA